MALIGVLVTWGLDGFIGEIGEIGENGGSSTVVTKIGGLNGDFFSHIWIFDSFWLMNRGIWFSFEV